MAERKVLNKYIPPNFNPNAIARIAGARTGQKKVRVMAPFSMRCNTCGEFIYKGKKFNARKEDAYDEDYLGIQIYRFYISCPLCSSEITYKTDPQNTDYICEHGAQRNFEPWREETRAHQEVKAERIKKEENNAMLALENRTMDSKREMDIMDALEEIQVKNAQLEKVDPDTVLDKIYGSTSDSNRIENVFTKNDIEKQQELEDEELAKSLFTDADGEKVKRILDSAPVIRVEEKPVAKKVPVVLKSKPVVSLGIKRKSQVSAPPTSKAAKTSVQDIGKEKKPLIDYPSSDDD